MSAGIISAMSFVAAALAATPVQAAGIALCQGSPPTINFNVSPNIMSTNGPDVILGTPGDDVIHGLGGNDRICGEGGNDTILPGLGDDKMLGGSGTDTVSYADAPDAVHVNLGSNSVEDTEGSGADALLDKFDVVKGSPFGDFLTDSNGNEKLKGGTGDDTFLVQAGSDVVKGGADTDKISFLFATKGITVDLSITTAQSTGVGPKTISSVENAVGSGFADKIYGSSGPNILVGDDSTDFLAGRGGIDDLNGGKGADQLFGGSGDSDECDGGSSDPALDTTKGCEIEWNIP